MLEGLCGHPVSLGARSIGVNYKDGREWVFAHKGGLGVGIANYKSSSAKGKELRRNLYAAAKKLTGELAANTTPLGRIYLAALKSQVAVLHLLRAFDRVQNGPWQNSPGWQIMVRRQFALAIPMAKLQVPS